MWNDLQVKTCFGGPQVQQTQEEKYLENGLALSVHTGRFTGPALKVLGIGLVPPKEKCPTQHCKIMVKMWYFVVFKTSKCRNTHIQSPSCSKPPHRISSAKVLGLAQLKSVQLQCALGKCHFRPVLVKIVVELSLKEGVPAKCTILPCLESGRYI